VTPPHTPPTTDGATGMSDGHGRKAVLDASAAPWQAQLVLLENGMGWERSA
jgi:hypothetical protein